MVKGQRQRKNPESGKRKVTCHIQRILNRLKTGISSETMEARRQWDDIVKKWKKKVNQDIPAKPCFKNGDINRFPDK